MTIAVIQVNFQMSNSDAIPGAFWSNPIPDSRDAQCKFRAQRAGLFARGRPEKFRGVARKSGIFKRRTEQIYFFSDGTVAAGTGFHA
jgi:hypothetical protein